MSELRPSYGLYRRTAKQRNASRPHCVGRRHKKASGRFRSIQNFRPSVIDTRRTVTNFPHRGILCYNSSDSEANPERSTGRCDIFSVDVYRGSQKNPPWGLVVFFPKRLGIFWPNFTCRFHVPIYARLHSFIQLSATLTKVCHIKRDHPVHVMCAKCPPSAETHAGIFWHFSQTVRNFSPNFTRLFN